ncbi:multicomponent Na+:H+ antiporter subunit D [Catalinimonas alkaloidigena]|uniref:proton-conducting transporter transmembrane domain-containing protein n=1 Tax=Catalinimonas alkaloidigena TaxID=1075417 RepID=UPI0024054732|nr:proton-conducting transporter membrane subunit [Catalinimonas alkaloidigena]MDF9795830.1 multicomponent Na+:H+ antiporter subunit D [Catalinimonas alkaloidigena]
MSESLMILTPLLSPFIGGIICIFFWKHLKVQKTVYLIFTLITLIGSLVLIQQVQEQGMLTIQAGNWKAPFGITLIVDMLSALMLSASAILGVVIHFFSLSHTSVTYERKAFGFYPALLLMLFGIHGALITGDIFNLYVWFEVMLIASFVLLTLGGEKGQLEGAVKYVTINFVASALFLAGIGIVYGITGSTNMAQLSVQLHAEEASPLLHVGLLFFITSFGIKAALFPLFFWLPASYHTPPIAISAIIAGLLTKVGIYALFRTAIFIFPSDNPSLRQLILVLAGLTMLTGIMGAIAQKDYRKVLSYLIISHMGYMVMGLGIGTTAALTGAIFYILHSIVVKSNLFFIGGLVGQCSDTFALDRAGGIYKRLPLLSTCFFISAMSLSGIPPLSGFWGKYALAQAGLIRGDYIIVAVSLLTGLLTLYVISRVWLQVFLKEKPEEKAEQKNEEKERYFVGRHKGMYTTVILLMFIILVMSFYAQPFVYWSETAAEQLLNRQEYIENVLGK